MASIQEREGKDGKKSYRVQVRLRGHPPASATFERKTDAKKWIQETETAIRQGRYFKTAEARKRTLGEAIDRYLADVLPQKPKNARHIEAHLLWWKERLGDRYLADVTASVLAEQRDFLLRGVTKRGGPRSPSTVVRYLASLSHLFTIAMKEWLWIDDHPLKKVSKPQEPRGRVRFLDNEERARFLEACRVSPHKLLYPFAVLALSTGMRAGEMLNLKWGDVDLAKGRIVLHQTKNGERRYVPLAGTALILLRGLAETRTSVFVFPGQTGQKPMCIRAAWESALRLAGISDFRIHDLRHCCASYLAMNGASLAEIAEILGHKTLQMVRRYAHLSESHVAKVVERMNEQIFG